MKMVLWRLHIRFWHAPADGMRKLLKAAGVRESTLKLIKDVVGTCRICRFLTRPTPKPIAPTRLSTELNQAVQWDVLFYKDHMVSHIVDEATRFCTASVLPSKSAHDLIRCIRRDWVCFFGAPRLIIADGEAGLDS